MTSKLTFNHRSRYELFSPISREISDASRTTFPRQQTLVIPKGHNQDEPLARQLRDRFPTIKVERGIADKYMIPWDKTDLGPRIGIAYQVGTKTVVRGGYGLFYGGEENQGGNPNRGEGVPFNQTMNLNLESAFRSQESVSWHGFPTAGRSIRSTCPPTSASVVLIENFRNPLVTKWNFTVQQDLGWGSALEVSYIGSKGSRQLINWDPNVPANSSRAKRCFRPAACVHSCAAASSRLPRLAARPIMAWPLNLKSATPTVLTMVSSYTWGHALRRHEYTAVRRAGLRLFTTSPADSAANTRAPPGTFATVLSPASTTICRLAAASSSPPASAKRPTSSSVAGRPTAS